MGMGNLGIAMGAGVDEIRRGQEQGRRDEELEIRKQEAARQADRYSWEQLDQKEKVRVREEGNAILQRYKPRFEAMAKGDYETFLPDALKEYNANSGGLNDGHNATLQSTPQGSVLNFMNKDGQVIHSQPINPQFVKQATQAAMLSELSAISPESARQGAQLDLEGRKVGATERTADAHMTSVNNQGRHFERADATAAKGVENQFALGQGHLGIAQANSSLQQQKWNIERPALEASADDTKAQRAARKELITAIDTGDQSTIDKAKKKAIAAGVKFDKPTLEFTTVVDQNGRSVTRTNKDTGEMDIVNPRTGEVKNIPGAGQPANVSFATEAEYERARKKGTVKAGDTVTVGGRRAVAN